MNFYAKASQTFGKINFFADLQYRMVFYKATSEAFADVDDTFRFFNPKMGANYQLNLKMRFMLMPELPIKNQDETIMKTEA